MKSPTPPRAAEHELAMSYLVSPRTRILTATILLATGVCVAAVFVKMPKSTGTHTLCSEGDVNSELAAVPLPNEAVATLLPTEMQRIVLPTLEMTPVTDDGAEKYAQAYPAPPSLAMINTEQGRSVLEEEPSLAPAASQKFEPMREIIEEKPIFVEPVNRDFPPEPTSVSTIERSDRFVSSFHFVENSRAEHAEVPGQPTDLFPIAVAPAISILQPLQPLQLGGLQSLPPLREIDL